MLSAVSNPRDTFGSQRYCTEGLPFSQLRAQLQEFDYEPVVNLENALERLIQTCTIDSVSTVGVYPERVDKGRLFDGLIRADLLSMASTTHRGGLRKTQEVYDEFRARLPLQMRAEGLEVREQLGYTYVESGTGLENNVLRPFSTIATAVVKGLLTRYMSNKEPSLGE